MLTQLKKLINVKSIMTFAFTGTMCYLAIKQNTNIPPELFAATVSAITTYFFTKKPGSEA